MLTSEGLVWMLYSMSVLFALDFSFPWPAATSAREFCAIACSTQFKIGHRETNANRE